MSKEIREQINKIKNLKQVLNESLEDRLSFLLGKSINLIKTHHTVGKWDDEKMEMEKITSDKRIAGFIDSIGKYMGHEIPGFSVVDDNGNKIAMLIYDEKIDSFVEGNTTYHFVYKGDTDKDERILQLVKDNLS